MPRAPVEKDMVDGLRDLRDQISTMTKTIVAFAESIDKRFDALEEESTSYRQKRLAAEADQAKISYEKKQAAFEEQRNGSSTQKMKTIASEAVKNELGANKIDYQKIWREKVVPALITTLAITLVLAILAVLLPGVIIPILQKAFGT